MTDFMHHDGEPVFVRGYSAVFNKFSCPHEHYGGRRGIIRFGAFDNLVIVRPLDLTCCAYHLEGPGFANMRWRNLRIWTDAYGLAFEAGPLPPTPVNRSIISAIVHDRLRGCSFMSVVGESRVEEIDGEEVLAIYSFDCVDHIGPVEEGAYPDACCWCSHEDYGDMSPYLQQVVAHWHANRPTEKPRPAVPSQPAARVAASKPTRKHPADDIDWAEPPPGVSRQDWLRFGATEQHARRLVRQQERYRRAS